jgi:hypothetical protein
VHSRLRVAVFLGLDVPLLVAQVTRLCHFLPSFQEEIQSLMTTCCHGSGEPWPLTSEPGARRWEIPVGTVKWNECTVSAGFWLCDLGEVG